MGEPRLRFATYCTDRDEYVDEHRAFVESSPGFICAKGRSARLCPPGTPVQHALTPKYSLGIIIGRTEDRIMVMWMVES